jgi:hypothetical protein
VVSVFAFVAIGRAIDLAAGAASGAQAGVVAQGAVTPTSLALATKRSATAPAASITTQAVTSTHAS